MKKRKYSLAVFSTYDPDGMVSDATVFYMTALANIAERIIVAVNGNLAKDEDIKIRKITDEIYRRPNTGFDFGAYKDVLENYLQPGELGHYKELILCNDTCYGPFVPFEDIFAQMQEKNTEFWSMNYVEDMLLPHFQSYFMVFQGKAIQLLLDFLLREVDSSIVNPIQACGYEHGLSEIILSNDIATDYYTSKTGDYHNLDIFRAPDYAIELLEFPLLKKRAFSDELSVNDNCRRALYMVAKMGTYPVSCILKNACRIYHKDFSDALQTRYITQISYFEKNLVSRREVILFCKKHKKVYIYGCGYMSVLFMARFKRYMNEFGGYVISDEYFEGAQKQEIRLYKLSQIDSEAPLIVAMTNKVAIQVADRVAGRENVLLLSVPPQTANNNLG